MIHSAAARGIGLLMLVLCASLPAASAKAQQSTAPQAPGQPQVGSLNLTDDKLEAFIVAAVKVDDVARKWRPQFEQAADEQQQAEVQQQARSEIMTAIDETDGVTVEEFIVIQQAAREDPELASRLNEMFRAQAEQ
jgi:hypothetical protein